METDWSLDYCLACDRQTSGAAYCSQICRLADLDSSSTTSSEPSSPISSTKPSISAFSPFLSRSPTAGLFLAPAFDFSIYRSSATSSMTASSSASSAPTSSAPVLTTCFPIMTSSSSRSSSRSTNSPRILTPSSSRSSLCSVQSTPVQGEIISTQGGDYTSSFEQVRDWRRRRMTTS